METQRVTQFLIILYCCTTVLIVNLNHGFAAEVSCEFPAIFNFGDSNSDTGGLAAAFFPPKSPYGETFFHTPAGRYSDGRLIIDFIAASLGLEYLSAYLNSVGSNFTYGANFATAASTITPQNRGLNQGGYSPFYLGVQYSQFQQFISRSQIIRNQGYTYAELLPMDKYFSQALYTFDIGQNDIGAGIFGNLSIQEINASIPNIINQFSIDFKSVYDEGARTFWIHNTGPIGCLPYVLANYPVEGSNYDSAGCATPYNKLAENYNQQLKELVIELRKELTSATITYVDIYTVKYNLISQASKYGFEQPTVACCGYGINEYNYHTNAVCGGTVNAINGTQIVVGACEKPGVRVNWDGVHYTEAANKWIFDQIVNGNFSDPPVPLRLACTKLA